MNEKQAGVLRNVLGTANSLAKRVTKNPVAKKALIGGAAGAATGAVGNMALGDKNESLGSRALKGGLVGGVIGGGAGGAAGALMKGKPKAFKGSIVNGDVKPVSSFNKSLYDIDGKTIPMKNEGGVFKAAFWLGFEKAASEQ